jgi:hypothetical protein
MAIDDTPKARGMPVRSRSGHAMGDERAAEGAEDDGGTVDEGSDDHEAVPLGHHSTGVRRRSKE